MKNNLTIVFDFDGTIVQSYHLIESIVRSLSKKYRLKEIDTNSRDVSKLSAKELLKAIEIKKWKLPFFIYEVKKRMNKQIVDQQLVEGIENAIKKLYDLGFNLVIVSSNSKQNIQLFLEHQQLNNYIDEIYAAPRLFKKEKTLKRIMKKHGSCIYIGDEVRDIIACHQAKMNIIAVSWGFNHASILKKENPTHLIHHPDDIIPLITH
ncbi:HAD-IA family hydrolase [Flammeovirga pacifica]|uniref:Carotenoid oxygenase n=1 Tax=Flammeovirga pacifica TaxID=915059 RepID=A0A1S1YWG4_FLAPC|nr:HAD-IA family hydrolase [Flammeovirga pacifica]OHX65361.1 hypothetical protein NH26_02845 [Flammeovirga pacifica]